MPQSELEKAFRDITIIQARLALPTDETRSRAESLETVRAHLRAQILTDDAAWNALDNAVQRQLETELLDLLGSYRRLAQLDGPADEGHLMSSKHASNTQIYSLALRA